MKLTLRAGCLLLACFGLAAGAQDWYHDRDARFQGKDWQAHVFEHVRTDLDHIGSAVWAAGREKRRLERTKEELADLQVKLNAGHFEQGELNDVIDSIRKSADDQRLSTQDRGILTDDLVRLRDYREHHEHWGH